ncbi:MAG: hypothetical protein N0A16_05085 [Blastocatellia bacterium]|nr:hypothetical protein [Blastocatellia bacterium]MCS7157087.1 hypothetical protein [Blastocatellia bacterium]MCX7752288.1 hypothetical protein [Blastocatellia bacterium]MDW8167780.1 hypothetical protein [Acidobacteriota bacterium]MDW8256601.1 hypothetical protein [Acidobacteriota bacterium]
MATTTRVCSLCQREITISVPERNPTEDLQLLSRAEIACAECVRRLGQHPDDRYVVLLGAYYRKLGNVHVKIAPVGAFHG